MYRPAVAPPLANAGSFGNATSDISPATDTKLPSIQDSSHSRRFAIEANETVESVRKQLFEAARNAAPVDKHIINERKERIMMTFNIQKVRQ